MNTHSSSDWMWKQTLQSKDVRWLGPSLATWGILRLSDGSISGLSRKRAKANSFTRASCYFFSSKEHMSTAVWQSSGAYHTSFNQERSTKSPCQTPKMYVNQMAWRDGVNLKAHIPSRSFPREIPVRGCFFERHFQPLSVGGFFSNQRESISRCPKMRPIANWRHGDRKVATWVLRNVIPFTPSHFRQSSEQIFLVLVFVFFKTVFCHLFPMLCEHHIWKAKRFLDIFLTDSSQKVLVLPLRRHAAE